MVSTVHFVLQSGPSYPIQTRRSIPLSCAAVRRKFFETCYLESVGRRCLDVNPAALLLYRRLWFKLAASNACQPFLDGLKLTKVRLFSHLRSADLEQRMESGPYGSSRCRLGWLFVWIT